MLDLISIRAESNVIAYFSDGKLQNLNIEITEAEQQECANLGRKILQRFASEIMADQVHSDSFRNKPEVAETSSGLADEVKDPNQMELPLSGATTTSTQVTEEKPKRGRKAKTVESAVLDLQDAAQMPISNIEITVKPELPPVEVSFTAVVGEAKALTNDDLEVMDKKNAEMLLANPVTIKTVLLTIDDLRTAVQEFISKNGKTEVAAQTAKLKALFASYGGSDVSTFPKNKIAECITKIQSL